MRSAGTRTAASSPRPHRQQQGGRRRGRSWTVSPDGKVFTFALKADVIFPSGKAATAEDAAFSLQRVVRPNKTLGFIITQFGFTRDNVETLVQATDPPDPAPRAARHAVHQLRAFLPAATSAMPG
jgi:ABC-type transport system substrate-binding protein